MNLVAREDGMIRGSRERVLNGGTNGRATLGIRPEHIRISNDGIAATVTSAEYHGADTVLAARVGEESLLVRTPGEVALAPGSQVRLGWEPGAVHIFDAENGRRK